MSDDFEVVREVLPKPRRNSNQWSKPHDAADRIEARLLEAEKCIEELDQEADALMAERDVLRLELKLARNEIAKLRGEDLQAERKGSSG